MKHSFVIFRCTYD